MEKHITEEVILSIWKDVEEDYFVRESVNDIVWHTEAISLHNIEDGPLILIRDGISKRRAEEGATQIFIHKETSKDLFWSIVTALDQLSLDTVDARIAASTNNLAFNTFVCLESPGQHVGRVYA